MGLLDNVRQTLSDVTESVVEQSKHLSAQTQLQVTMKKLQLERAKKIHELGKQTFDWYRAGNMAVGGQVPATVMEICRQLDDVERQLHDTEHELEQLKLQAAQQAQTPPPPQVTATVSPPVQSSPAQPSVQPPTASTTSHDTQVLGGTNTSSGAGSPGPGPGA